MQKQPLRFFGGRNSILDVWQGSEYASEFMSYKLWFFVKPSIAKFWNVWLKIIVRSLKNLISVPLKWNYFELGSNLAHWSIPLRTSPVNVSKPQFAADLMEKFLRWKTSLFVQWQYVQYHENVICGRHLYFT